MENKLSEQIEKIIQSTKSELKALFTFNSKVIIKAEDATPADIEYKEHKTKDGSTVRITGDVAEGSKIEVVAEDGSLTAVPDSAEITLESGDVIVAEGGLIKSVKKAEITQQANIIQSAQNPADPNSERLTKIEDQLTTINKSLELLTQLSGSVQKFADQQVALSEVVSVIAKQPVIAPAGRTAEAVNTQPNKKALSLMPNGEELYNLYNQSKKQ